MTDYFVSNAGSDAANGLTTGTAWQTIAKVNGFSFSNGDDIFFRRGDRWYEKLTVPHAQLTFGAYGADAVFDDVQYDDMGRAKGYGTNAPVIDGGQLVTGWTEAPQLQQHDLFTGTAGVDLLSRTPDVGTAWIRHGETTSNSAILTAAGRARRANGVGLINYKAQPVFAGNDYRVKMRVYVASLLANDAAYVYARCTASGSPQFYAMALGPTSWSLVRFSSPIVANATLDTGAFTPVVGQTYELALEVEGTTQRAYIDGVLYSTKNDTNFVISGLCGMRLGSSTAAAQSDTTGFQVDEYTIEALHPTHKYKATGITVRPRIVDAFEAYSHEGTSVAALLDGQWVWDNTTNILWIRNDTITAAPSDTDVAIDARDYCVDNSSHTGNVFEDLAFEHAAYCAIRSNTGSGTRVSRCYAQRCTRSYRDPPGESFSPFGVFSFINHSSPIIEDCVVREVGGEPCWIECLTPIVRNCRLGPAYESATDIIHDSVVAGPGPTVNGKIYNNYMTQLGSATTKGCVIVFGDGWEIHDNYFAHANWGVTIDGNDAVISRNVAYNCLAALNIDDHSPGQAQDNIQYDHNIAIDCRRPIIITSMSGAGSAARTNLVIVANTVVNTSVAPTSPQFDASTSISGVFKDNILWSEAGGANLRITTVGGGGWDSDHNLIAVVPVEAADWGAEEWDAFDWTAASTADIAYLGTTYDTLAAYVAAASKDANSFTARPAFRAVGNPTGDADGPFGEYYRNEYRSRQHRAGVVVAGLTEAVGAQDVGALQNTDGYSGLAA